MPFRAALFDIDDTLYDSSRLSVLARRHAVEAMVDAGLKVGPAEAEERLFAIVAEYGSNDNRHFDRLLADLNVQRRRNQFIAAAVTAYHNTKLTYLNPFEETVPALLELRERGMKLGVITNGKAVKQWEKLIRLGLQHFFHVVCISEELGVAKPAPEIFEATCEQLGLSVGDCFFVGNSLSIDVAGAKSVGMLAIHMKRGRHADDKPRGPLEVPDFTISRLRDLLRLLDSGAIG